MKSYKGIVSRYIKQEKRSVVPIFISIILTISVITSIVFITENILLNNREEKKILFGDYDVRLEKINNERLNKLKSHENVEDYTLGKNIDNLNVKVDSEKWKEISNGIRKNDEDIIEGTVKNIENIESIEEIEGDRLVGVNVYAVEKRFLDEYINFNIIEGKLPGNENEIVLDKNQLDLLPKGSGVGSVIEFNVIDSKLDNEIYGENISEENDVEEKNIENVKDIINTNKEILIEEVEKVKYTIVGIIEPNISDSLFTNKILRLLSQEEINDKSGEFEAFTYLKDLSKEKELANDLGLRYIKPIITMTEWLPHKVSEVKYLDYNKKDYGSIMQNESLRTILVVAIIFCFMAVYNTFNSSIANRIKVYGILRAIGGTTRQISNLIYLEAMILYISAIPIGLILGYAMTKIESYILINSMGLLESFDMGITLEMILIILISVFGIIFFAVRSVLKKEGKLTPIEAITDARGLNKNMETKANKNSLESLSEAEQERYMMEVIAYEKTTIRYKITKKIFKFEGELAHKNIIRDVKTHKLTKWTIFIAMTTIIFFFLQIVNWTISSKSVIKSDKWDVEVSLNGKDYDDSVINEIENTDGVGETYKYSTEKVYLVVPGESVSRLLNYILFKRQKAPEKVKESQGITANIISLDEKTIELYDGIDKEKLDNGGVLIVNKASNYWIRRFMDGTVMYVYSHMNPALKSDNFNTIRVAEDDTVITEEGLKTYQDEGRTFKDLDVVGTVDDDILYSTYNSINMQELDYDIKLLTTEKGFNKIMGNSVENQLLIKTKNNEERIDTISSLQKISANNNYIIKDTIGDKLAIERNRNEEIALNIIFGITVIIMVTLNLINTSNSSILARRKELAAMRAIGMSSNQQMKMIIAETFYISISVAFNVFLIVGLFSMATVIALITAKKVTIMTLIVGQVLIIIMLMIITNVTVLSPLVKARKFSIADDLKEE